MGMEKQEHRHGLAISMVLSGAILAVVYGWTIFTGKTLIYMDIGADTYCSYWPDFAYLRNCILSGNYTLWSFTQGLGTNNIGMLSNLFVPTYWLIYVFPTEKMYIGIMLAAIIRTLLLQFFSYGYVREMGLNKWASIAASLCITFCGFFIGWGQHYLFGVVFVDFIAILYGFECALKNERKWLAFVLPLAHLLIISFYFAYMTLLFLALYATVRFFMIGGKLKNFFGYAFRLLRLVLLGGGLSLGVALPKMLLTLNSGRVSGRVYPSFAVTTLQELITNLSRLVSNTAAGVNQSFGVLNFYETAFYFAGSVLPLMAVLVLTDKNRTKRQRCFTWIIAGIVILSFVFPHLYNPIFNAFSADTTRWTFVLVPIFALAVGYGIQIILREELSASKKGILLLVTLCEMAVIEYIRRFAVDGARESQTVFSCVCTCVLLLAYFVVVSFAPMGKKRVLICSLLVLDLMLNSSITVNLRNNIRADSIPSFEYFDHTEEALNEIRKTDQSFYRVGKTYAKIDLKDSYIQDYFGEKEYSSTNSQHLLRFLEYCLPDGSNTHYVYGFDSQPKLRDYLSVKYMLSKEAMQMEGWELWKQIEDIYVYINQNVKPLGYAYHVAIDEEQAANLTKENRVNLMGSTAIVQNAEIAEQLRELPGEHQICEEMVIERFSEDQIVGHINMESDGLLYLSVPYDKGWRVQIDGRDAKIECVNYGFIGIEVGKGTHSVEFSFVPSGLKEGGFISLMSLVLMGVCICGIKTKNRTLKRGK